MANGKKYRRRRVSAAAITFSFEPAKWRAGFEEARPRYQIKHCTLRRYQCLATRSWRPANGIRQQLLAPRRRHFVPEVVADNALRLSD